MPVRSQFASNGEFLTALRDYFAGQALGLLPPVGMVAMTHSQRADYSYALADAMLTAREKSNG